MALCRIYLFTYKRNNLLPRAVNSLMNQTFTNWVCEVHNDCPEDDFPAAFVKSLNDERFIVKDHATNLGGVKSFNLAFEGCEEEYAGILEDDNWWEPAFLKEMIAMLDREPGAQVAWSNMNLWKEKENGGWEDLHQTTWQQLEPVKFFSWPDVTNAMSAYHSNSALLYRGNRTGNYQVPDITLLNAVELIRERTFEYPLLLNARPLANFAVTLSTNRTSDPIPWIASQVMMLASFIGTAPDKKQTFSECLRHYRKQKPVPTANFFLAVAYLLKNNSFYRLFNLRDWLMFGKWLVKNGIRLGHFKQYLKDQREVYDFLLKKTALQYARSRTPDIGNNHT